MLAWRVVGHESTVVPELLIERQESNVPKQAVSRLSMPFSPLDGSAPTSERSTNECYKRFVTGTAAIHLESSGTPSYIS